MGIFLFLNIGGSELVLILLVVLILFGGKGLPTLARSMGRAMREFREAAMGIEREIYSASQDASSVAKEIQEKIQEIKKELPRTDNSSGV